MDLLNMYKQGYLDGAKMFNKKRNAKKLWKEIRGDCAENFRNTFLNNKREKEV